MFKKIFNRKAAKNLAIAAGVALVLAGAAITVKDEIYYNFFYDGNGSAADNTACPEGTNVALINIHGTIIDYKIDPAVDPNESYDPDSVSADTVAASLEDIESDDRIKGIIIEIDSPGGTPVAAEEIMNKLRTSTKPVVAFIRAQGLSAGYLIATGADKIYASPMSDVGSIGVTMSYLDSSKKNTKDGLTYNQLSTGKFKDSGDPNKELTAEEKARFMGDLEKTHDIFVGYVAKNRNLDIEKVKKLADGSSMIAQDALNNNLIDALGGLKEAKAYLSSKIDDAAAVCVY